MNSNMLRTVPRSSAPFLSRSFQQRSQVLSPVLSRTYAGETTRDSPNTSNVANPQASNAEDQEVNKSRGKERGETETGGSTQSPVSNPAESGIGGQEEQTQSQAEMKRDPSEPDSKKREEVLKHGQGKKLDPADE
ncbi:hypothetical protein BU26DRAFT_574033 [Trematosphaeria pertusa]|uniref:HAD-like protein n=1 Tax=Trematosphaeria pertusa TaxID=390896 RepID=A0A6A6J3T9_9PLEO|nr:uncharacterized protein BU26DRAFT_574033 [Trematosphaeria pertusa]KAF2256143.1 hypothetical protein BU26DRAFT_574033 [Trematosphaeria pertusa]